MKIAKNSVVEVIYEVRVDGKVVDSVSKDAPLDYIQGMGMLIPKFEQEIEGQEPGYEFDFIINPEDEYGEHDPKAVVEIPKSAFMVNGVLRDDLLVAGNVIPMFNSANEVCQGTVAEVKDETVVMDFNHPMAGKVMNFKGQVLTVREATEKELLEGLHGEFLPREEGHCHCCGGHHEDGQCCGGHHHEDGEGHCCGGHHEDGEGHCCGGHHHE